MGCLSIVETPCFLKFAATLVLACYTAVAFGDVDPLAGQLLFPYVAWVLFSTVWNFEVLRVNNKPADAPSQGSNQTFLRT